MTSHRDRILHFLRLHPGEWVAGEMLDSPEVGGPEATRRIRELRAEGHDIAMRARFGGRAEYRLTEQLKASSYWSARCPGCGFTGEEPVFTHFFNEWLCPKCGARVM